MSPQLQLSRLLSEFAKISELVFTTMLRISSLLFCALLITAPALAGSGSGGCMRSQETAATESTDQKQETEAQS